MTVCSPQLVELTVLRWVLTNCVTNMVKMAFWKALSLRLLSSSMAAVGSTVYPAFMVLVKAATKECEPSSKIRLVTVSLLSCSCSAISKATPAPKEYPAMLYGPCGWIFFTSYKHEHQTLASIISIVLISYIKIILLDNKKQIHN